MKRYLFILLIMTAFITSASSQSPVLQVSGNKNNKDVYLQSLDIQVEVTGSIATTTYLMVFKNKTSRILEGELLFPLPEGTTVSAYALDINGKLRQAVPVEKAKATQVFEEIEQRNVDPGILERVEGNNFRTRIYPIPSNGTRTISISYEMELPVEKGSLRYRLPMDYKHAIEKFSLKASIFQSKATPKIEESFSNELEFDKKGNNYVAEFNRSDYRPGRSLSFALPVKENIPQVVVQSASGSYYFLASCDVPAANKKKTWSDRLGIIWDNSLSGAERDIEQELNLLDIIIKGKQNLSITLYFLNNRFSIAEQYDIKNGDWSNLRKKLETTTYDGGTAFNQIRLTGSANEYLLFSDGMSTLSDSELYNPSNKYPVHCIVSSSKADYSSMKWIAFQSGGKFINLNALSESKLKEELHNETLNFLGIENVTNIRETYPSLKTPVRGNFSIAGILDNNNNEEITLLFGYGTKVEKRIKVKINPSSAMNQGNIHRVWAQKKINELDMNYEKNKEELTELGQIFGIVTRNTSLIVLETFQDYIRYNITPPAELQSEYTTWRKAQDEVRLREQESLLSVAKDYAKELIDWWKRDFYVKANKYPKPDNDDLPPIRRYVTSANMMVAEPEIRIETLNDESSITVVEEAAYESVMILEMADQMLVTQQELTYSSSDISSKSIKKEKASISTRKSPTISITPLKQDNDYIKVLTGKAKEDYNSYLRLRSEYINTPTFYFDMSEWFFNMNEREIAIRILTSIAELEIENASLLRLIGYRLKEYKEYQLETYICKKVIDWRPMEPQSYRDYALALSDAGKHQDALNALYSVITQSYANNISQRSAGIEEVVVTELNQIIHTNKVSSSEIDKDLIHAMPVDIRVVINWNMNSTDIDLHVKDPRGETCYYSNKRTELGGRISRDITQGYGPEQFMLKKAIPGKYKVYVNYFGDSQVKAEGPSTIMAEIYTHYSDKSQKREVVCLQLSKDQKARTDSGLIEIAEFEF